MERNWLIRTKSNHILGPVSKEKVLELYHNGSIKPDDEICCGNGYWFFIREDDMVKRFLLGEEHQSFNPISEAKDVLKKTPADDITLVGTLDLSGLRPETDNAETDNPGEATSDSPDPSETIPAENKKKNNLVTKRSSKSFKKQNYFQYIALAGFIILFLMIYYRKTIIRIIFHGEITTSSFSLINSAIAQENTPGPKLDILGSSVSLDKITFKPNIGWDGFKVVSSFNIEEVACPEFENEINQLAVILYPPELINEKFLIKMRDCILELKADHPLKKWFKWVGKSAPLSKKKEETKTFLAEVINSKFNLITDNKIKNKIIYALNDIPEETLPELVLKSYLYLIIGNITRSDNLLKEYINLPPRRNWERNGVESSYFHQLSKEQMSQIFAKFERHPVDRRIFQLFSLYLQYFYNDEILLNVAREVSTSKVKSEISLKYVEGIAPSFVKFLRLKNTSESRRFARLRKVDNFPLRMQAYWIWPFFEITPLVSETMNPELQKIEKEDELWFIYLMQNEKLADLYAKKSGKIFLPVRRTFLKNNLENKEDFMMSLYKLIELGDINSDLVQKTASYLIHE